MRKIVLFILLAVTIVFFVYIAVQFRNDMKTAHDRLIAYNSKTLETVFGKMTYLDEGNGEAILVSHGIFGGYDQGFASLYQLVGNDYRKISISRFGYPGSEMPENPTPENQAAVFLALLDELGIEKAYILTTSAGGAAGLRFALDYPDRVSGLILLSSGVPYRPGDAGEINKPGRSGPPQFIVNDFPMWLCMKYFGFIFDSMMGSKIEGTTLYETMLPVSPRKQGIAADTEITNTDMMFHYNEYALEEIAAPILVVHAKDDPLVKYENIESFLGRVNAQSAVFNTGGHLITGHGDAAGAAIRAFIESR